MTFKTLTLLLSVTQLCGLIVGTAIDISAAPWQASVLVNDKHRCGGAIYSENVVLTTAQCVNRVNLDKLAVRVGSDKKDLGGQVVSVKKVTMQVLGRRESDVAILILDEPLELSDNVQSIELATRSPRQGTKASVTGWAEVVGADPPQEILIETNLTIVDKQQCSGSGFLIKPLLTLDEVCVSKSSSNNNLICQGFSGGPLVSDGKLIGIGAWNTKCDFLQSPSVFANIPTLKLWITGATKLINIFNN